MSQIQTSNWSQTAASNNAASPNGMPEGMAPSGVNDSVREVMSALKIDWCQIHGLDNSGALISSAGGTTTYTVTNTTAPASLYTGMIQGFKANSTCAVDPTLNVNSLGAVNVQKMTAAGYVNLAAGDWVTGQHVMVKYDGTLAKWIMLTPVASFLSDPTTTRGDMITRGASVTGRLAVGAAGAVLMSDGTDPAWDTTPTITGVTTVLITSTGVGLSVETTAAGSSTEGPRLDLKRSATGASGNLLGAISYVGRDDAGNEETFVKESASIVDATNGSEDGQWSVATEGAGTIVSRMSVRLGLIMRDAAGAMPTGNDKGVGTINAFAVYDENVLLTDYVFDQAVDAKVNFGKYAGIARGFESRALDIDWLTAYWREHRHFPNIPGMETWTEETRPSVGKLTQMLLEIAEVQAIHIAQLNDRLKALEAKATN